MFMSKVFPLVVTHKWIVMVLLTAPALSSAVSAKEESSSREIRSCDEFTDIQVSEVFSDWHCSGVVAGQPALSSTPIRTESGACRYKNFHAPIEHLKYAEEAPHWDEPGLSVLISVPFPEQCPEPTDGCYVAVRGFEPGSDWEAEYLAVLEALREWVTSNLEPFSEKDEAERTNGFCQGMYYYSISKEDESYLALGRADGRPIVYNIEEIADGQWEVIDFEKEY